jgi:hypothetical protein
MSNLPKREPSRWTPEEVRDISEAVYKKRLEDSNKPAGAVARMIADDKDNGEKLRNRAGAYDPLTRAYLEILSERWSIFEP